MTQELERQSIVLEMINALRQKESWCGETHVQKCMYFLQEGLGHDTGFSFFLYKHGPFSFDLRESLGEMRGFEFLRVRNNEGYGASLEVTEQGNKVIELFSKTNTRLRSQVDFIASKIAPKGVGVVSLERRGTALFVFREDSTRSDAEMASRINELKPHIPISLAAEAIRDVRQLLDEAAASQLLGHTA